ncbi:MAG: hypothetical protein Q7S70_02075 [bacterium]|nr:hypothetical protein [bacterium]
MKFIPLHAIFAIASSLLALKCALTSWRRYKENGNPLIKYLALDFFSMFAAMLFLAPPSLFHRSELLPFFLAPAVFLLFLGIAFFLQITVSSSRKLIKYRKLIFFLVLAAGVFLAAYTFSNDPSLSFEKYGLMTQYTFPPLIKLTLAVFTVFSTSFLSSLVFFGRAFSISASPALSLIRARSVVFGIALIFIGIGVLLVLLGEKIFYNFFIFLAFVLFYLNERANLWKDLLI